MEQIKQLDSGKVLFKDEDGNKYKRQPCEVWSRAMWYFRPVSYYNEGKKAEWYSRKDLKEQSSLNNKFNETYANS